MGTSAHLSPLLRKAWRLGIRSAKDLETIALARGLRYFATPGVVHGGLAQRPATPAVDPARLSNEELAIALANPAAPYSLKRIRMAAAIMAADGVSAETIVRLACQERCESIVAHIARCGSQVEPSTPSWQSLLEHLPDTPPAKPDILPHISRFVAMAGITRNGRQTTMQWIRPS